MTPLQRDANDLIERVKAVILRDGTAACPYAGHAHLYSGPRKEAAVHVLGYSYETDRNHIRAKEIARITGATLIDDTNISKEVLENVNDSGLNLYDYLKQQQEEHASQEPEDEAKPKDKTEFKIEADRVMRYASLHFVDSLHGRVDTSVCGAARDRVFFEVELPRLGEETASLITGIAKARDIEIVNDGSIMDIRKLFKHHAIETAYRLVCINEQDMLHRMAWKMGSEKIMQHYLGTRELYMIDREQAWKAAAHELFQNKIPAAELIRLDRKMTRRDHMASRAPRHYGAAEDRLSQKEIQLVAFVAKAAATAFWPKAALRMS
ncbi:MAG: hypothetical protein FWF24_03435 [Alphaproteobacteria bacterium]|nr:hypothetical protein [Alphaproteobacteria bacterium]